jgi:hypothetical protein
MTRLQTGTLPGHARPLRMIKTSGGKVDRMEEVIMLSLQAEPLQLNTPTASRVRTP